MGNRGSAPENRRKTGLLKGRWPKGVSGNPGGRPRLLPELRALAQRHSVQAVEALVRALKRPGERVPAARVLLSYGYGLPVQAVEVGGVAGGEAVRVRECSHPDPERIAQLRELILGAPRAARATVLDGAERQASDGGNGKAG